MTTQRRNFARTPRREKVFASITDFDTPTVLVQSSVNVPIDLLANYKTDVGVTRVQGVTAMRIFGSMYLGNLASATNAAIHVAHWGIAWMRNNVLTAGLNDAQIPDPSEAGAREVPWLQTGYLIVRSSSTIPVVGANESMLGSFVHVDITQQRKQPGTDYGLGLVIRASGPAGTDPGMWINLTTMLALP